MAKRLIMMVGLPASGKSSLAKKMLEEFGTGNCKVVNKDQLRLMLDNGKWSGTNENFVLSIRDKIIIDALAQNLHVIVDDTNLHPKHEQRLREIAKQAGANFEEISFKHVSVDECIARDRKRANYVGERVIREQYNRFLKPKVIPAPIDLALPWCVISDLDGTLCDGNGRNPYTEEKCGEDLPRHLIIDLACHNASSRNIHVILVSGRQEKSRDITQEWLHRHQIPFTALYMRPTGDTRKDTIVKEEIYREHILGKYNVYCVFDDRASVVRAWTDLGLEVIRVGKIDQDEF